MTTIKINLAATTCQEKTGLSKKCVRFFQDETLTTAGRFKLTTSGRSKLTTR